MATVLRALTFEIFFVGALGKLSKHIAFDMQLDMSQFLSRKALGGDGAAIFDLYAVLVHRGSSAHCGIQMYMCMYVHACTPAHTHRQHKHTHTYTRMRARTQIHTHTHTHTHTHRSRWWRSTCVRPRCCRPSPPHRSGPIPRHPYAAQLQPTLFLCPPQPSPQVKEADPRTLARTLVEPTLLVHRCLLLDGWQAPRPAGAGRGERWGR